MRITAKSEYATRALVDLVLQGTENGHVQVRDIATRQNVPEKYLVQILLVLKHAGIVESRRGADGGYRLAKPAVEITLGEVVRAVEGPLMPLRCFTDADESNAAWPLREHACALWAGIRKEVADVLDSRTFADLARDFTREPSHMYYI